MKIAYVVIGAIVLAVVVGAAGFYGGMTYAQSQTQNTVANFARARGIQNQQGAGQGAANAAGGATANNPCGFPGGFAFGGGQGGQGAQGNAPAGAQQGTANGTQAQGAPQGGQRRQGGGQFGGQAGGFGAFGNAQLGNCVARGEIKSVDGNTVQISTAENVVTVKVNDTTVISKTDRGTIGDLKVGDRVTVFSQETGDSPTASGIQLQPAAPQQQQQ